MTEELLKKGTLAKQAARGLALLTTEQKNNALLKIADALIERCDEIITQNAIDIKNAQEKGISSAMLDRLTLTKKRIEDIADGVRQVAGLDDPIGEKISEWTRPNGLKISQMQVPMGVIGIIYEARPNVTVDAAVLCLKTSNAVILRGGSEAINSNIMLMKIMQEAAYSASIPEGALNIIEDTSRDTATKLMKMNGYIDMLIPRGGQGLIRSVVENATVPVVETAAGNCHIYVDGECDMNMAEDIVMNAKISRPSVCNAVETLLIDKKIASEFLPVISSKLAENNVEIRACGECLKIVPNLSTATEADWDTEYNDYIIAVKLVDGIDEAISHIHMHSTNHSEAIITANEQKAERFLKEIDSAAVYVNASTRFTDGFEFGFGAEIGISTQKMHARGPMGLKQLTSVKYIIHGNGQTR